MGATSLLFTPTPRLYRCHSPLFSDSKTRSPRSGLIIDVPIGFGDHQTST